MTALTNSKIIPQDQDAIELLLLREQGLYREHPANSMELCGDEALRFWAKVARGGPEECWEWTGSCKRGSLGYGAFALSRINPSVSNPTQAAHKVALVLSGVHVPDGAVILHSCDNPKCVNPRHLTPGTQMENVRDMIAKGRAVFPPKKIPAPDPDLTVSQRAIYEWLVSMASYGREYPIPTVYKNHEELLLKHGEWFKPQLRPKIYGPGTIKQCFHNSGFLAHNSLTSKRRPRLWYVEGYAIWNSIPIHHGWASDEEGNVIDVTWRFSPEEVENMAYFGLRFEPSMWLVMHTLTNQCSFLEDWEHRYPILHVPFDGGASPAFLTALQRQVEERAARRKEMEADN